MKEKILVIDTDPFNLSIVKQVMESAGYKVLTALDGESGLQQFHKYQLSLIILDIMLPPIDGWEICRRIRKVSNVPIIVHTALESPEHILRAIRVGANDYLVKPVVPEMIKIRVETILKHRTQREQLWPQWLSSLSSPEPEFVGYM
jgi:DNA-binding response OmpR family regulator